MRSDTRGFLSGSATIGAMLLVSGSAKLGYGVWALGMAALTCILYGAGKYVLAHARMLVSRRPWVTVSRINPHAKLRSAETATALARIAVGKRGTFPCCTNVMKIGIASPTEIAASAIAIAVKNGSGRSDR